ncbi:GNAT family N-acetyltransferase [Spirochaeta isovalerica]|uniref:GNAT superfamily N-acetyltransferase n=1 Tax=Spirochaeta isovalerica TaxID=150 RepID=A0A841RBC5_9SPIO|nr:GNAT family N-acetyltransferase [Spirochaeta isovalerica]MBB6481265.1 GNAT superfamily N-acetyltransferase [Spirochaeta isovalerica]
MIRTACKDDASRIAEIHIFGWRSAYRGIIPDSYLFSEISVNGRFSSFNDSNEHEKDDLYVCEEDNIIKGFMKSGMCRNEDKLDAYELWGLYVEPLMKREGVGSQLLRHCEKVALEKGCRENVLWVLEDNASTRQFYKKHGYETDGSEKIMEKFNAKVIRYCKKITGDGEKK